MAKFVKIKGYPNWFFLIESKEDILPNMEETAHSRLKSLVGGELLKDNFQPENFMARMIAVCDNKPNYAALLDKYKMPILVRQIGSFTVLDHYDKITNQIIGNDFPLENENAEIVICENDQNAELFWVEYLQKRFPGKKIQVLNFFRTRNAEDIKAVFSKAKYVTFSTTFSSLDWFELLVGSLSTKNKVIGFSHGDWEQPIEMLKGKNKLEIVDLNAIKSISNE